MPKGDSLKRYKEEQKLQTRKKLEEAIRELKASGGAKISVDQLATLCGISRATIYANYKDLLDNLSTKGQTNSKQRHVRFKENESIINKLREENRELRLANNQLIDQVVAMKLMFTNKIETKQ
ncbi:MAG: TetR/AcrR family transcriptional regulator [Epsilonproteobacteria bacterium]|nr:TetR/AcrR family transcriptional regulator [Campylobacterota bacterium]